MSNYRLISLLFNLDKITQKLMYNRIIQFLEDNKIIYYKQFGFCKNFCTAHAIITLIENVQSALDNKKFAYGIFIDLKKAFDTVDHNILLSKLNYYGMRGIANDWFKSYLINRSQFVSINGFNSDNQNIEYGVPQGSVLGSLLFSIFVKDLNFTIRNSSTFHFADDTCFLNIKSTIKEINKYVNKDLRSLLNWLNANKSFLIISSTEVSIFKRKGRVIDTDLKLKLCGKKLFTSKSVKYLGVILDECLQWNFHINQLCLKLNKANAMLCKIRHYVNETTLRSSNHIFHMFALPGVKISNIIIELASYKRKL